LRIEGGGERDRIAARHRADIEIARIDPRECAAVHAEPITVQDVLRLLDAAYPAAQGQGIDQAGTLYPHDLVRRGAAFVFLDYEVD
jgi:hypothetical protein